MFFVDLEQAKEKEIAPGVRIKVAWGERIMLSLVHLDAGSTVPMHSHPHEQVGIVLEGEFDFTIGGVTKRVKRGDTYFIPGGVEHGCQAYDQPAVALDIFHPIREEYK